MTSSGLEHHEHLDPLVHVDQVDHPDALADARARAGRAVRDIGHELVGHEASVELLDRVTATLDALSAELANNAARNRAMTRRGGDWGPSPADGAVMSSFDERPFSGRASPWGLDFVVHRDGDDAVAMCTLRAAHEGAPGRSHGGVVAALFDDMYGFVLTILAQPAFTGEISIRYHDGVPIGVPMECRVRCTEHTGRKILVAGELTAAGHTVASSTGVFIAVDPTKFGLPQPS
jgi:acyl-coenzyme A thioesterase PaaI-like protein